MKKIFQIVIIVLSTMTACSEQEPSDIIERDQNEIEFTATYGETETKSILIQDGLHPNGQPKMITWWSPREEICIYYGASDGSKFTSTNTERVQKATFRGNKDAFSGEDENGDSNYYWAIYPYDAAVSCDGESVVAVLADEQEAFAGSYANKTNVSIAKSSGLKLGFYNVCSFLRFSVENEGIIAATFRGNNNEDVAGKFCVSIGEDGKPTMPIIIEGEKEITLTRPNNEPFVVGESYYFVILPQTFENGFTVQFETAKKVGNRIISTSAPFDRNRINYGISAFDSGVTYTSNELPPENEFWYTTSDESMIIINEDLQWYQTLSGPKNHVIYHKYKRGKGIVRFDGPVNHIPLHAFEGYEKMTSIKLPSNVETIQAYAFAGTSISSISLPNSLTYIGNYAFKNVQTLTAIGIEASVKRVGFFAFQNSGITSASVYAQELEDYAFKDSKLKTLMIGSSCSKIGTGIVVGCTDLESIEVAFDNPTFTSVYKNNSQSTEMNCIMRISDRMVLAGCKNTHFNTLNSYGSYSIDTEAFKNVGLSGYVGLQPISSLSIGISAFWGNNIQTLVLGNDYTTISIEGTAFGGNPNLSSVYFYSNKLPTVYQFIFGYDNNFTVYVPSSRLNDYKTIQYLDEYASLMVGF